LLETALRPTHADEDAAKTATKKIICIPAGCAS
jgi:hypothetical protein